MKDRAAPPTMPFMLGLLMLFAIFAGCLGGDDGGSEYSGPIDIVLIQSAKSGTLLVSKSNGNNTVQHDDFNVSFDLSGTTSGSGDIVQFILDPGDGTEPIVADASDDSVIEHDYGSHGQFTVSITAIDSEDNEHTITSAVCIDYQQLHINQNTDNPDVVWVDYIGSRTEAPMLINVTSTVENIDAGLLGGVIGNDNPVTVTWTLYDGQNTVVNETQETIEDGDEATFEHSESMPTDSDWRLEITLSDSENVNADTDFAVSYDHSDL